MKNNILGQRVGHILTDALNSIELSLCFNVNISVVCMDTVHLVGAVSFVFYIFSKLFSISYNTNVSFSGIFKGFGF